MDANSIMITEPIKIPIDERKSIIGVGNTYLGLNACDRNNAAKMKNSIPKTNANVFIVILFDCFRIDCQASIAKPEKIKALF